MSAETIKLALIYDVMQFSNLEQLADGSRVEKKTEMSSDDFLASQPLKKIEKAAHKMRISVMKNRRNPGERQREMLRKYTAGTRNYTIMDNYFKSLPKAD